jgi:hypothetical protein
VQLTLSDLLRWVAIELMQIRMYCIGLHATFPTLKNASSARSRLPSPPPPPALQDLSLHGRLNASTPRRQSAPQRLHGRLAHPARPPHLRHPAPRPPPRQLQPRRPHPALPRRHVRAPGHHAAGGGNFAQSLNRSGCRGSELPSVLFAVLTP